MREKLATIEKIREICPIDGADKICVCVLEDLEWECVISKKDNFSVGDFIVYIQIDSKVPERQEFEFLRERGFKVKTIRLRKQISQGLIIPLTMLPKDTEIIKGKDVTDMLGVTNYQKDIEKENDSLVIPKHRSKVMQFLMRNKAFRTVYMKLNSKEKGAWPNWIAHTDEERIQTCAKVFMNNFDKAWYITEKLDGQSATFFTYSKRVWGLKRKAFGVCSRNIWLKTPDNSNYWKVAKNFNLEKKMLAYDGDVIIQGEILAPNVQKNKYKMTDTDFYVFNVIINGKRLSACGIRDFCLEFGLNMVPVLDIFFTPKKAWPDLAENTSEVVKKMVAISTSTSKLLPEIQREGIVVRLIDDPYISFKTINPEFCLKYGE